MKQNGAPFIVMDASAGSGKTRNLVKQVLVKALAEVEVRNSLRPTLALTFTNKAATEMKHRLLDYLIDFSREEPQEVSLINEIAEELNLKTSEVKSKAKKVLRYLLHHFNDLSFGTLDSFTSRLVRTFAKDMALGENFEITLDLETLLLEATDVVMSKAGLDEDLTQILVQFVETKLAEEKSPSIDFALFDVAQKLMEERHRKPLEKLSKYTPEDLLDIRESLIKRIENVEKNLQAYGQKALEIIANHGLTTASFVGGKNGFGNIFNYFDTLRIDKSIAYTKTVEGKINKGEYYPGKATADEKEAIDACIHDLLDLASKGMQLAAKNAAFIIQAKAICKNMFAMATLNALNQALNELSEVRNTLPLAAFNSIVHEKLEGEPSLYIYERLGERYNHFYLDEFQDTSELQWDNLKPLIKDSLASTGSALIVGDAKQSIYRWRNGEAEQFIKLSENAEKETFQFKGDAYLHQLADNWRSRKEIVNFNNALFASCALLLKDEAYKALYGKAAQLPKKGDGGYVQINTLEESDFDEETLSKSVNQIKHLVAEGYAHKDIAVLVRSSKHGAELVQQLTTQGIPVISGDSLLLGSAFEPQLLAGFTAIRTAPNNKQMRWQLADALIRGGFISPQEGNFNFAKILIELPKAQLLHKLNELFSGLDDVFNDASDLYTFTRSLVKTLGLSGKNNAFTESYVQAVQDFVSKEQGTDFDFLQWWNDEASKKSITAADNIDAVQVVTIHKSKGLQYPIVLLPFANWQHRIGSREAWIKLDPEEYEGLDEMLISLNQLNVNIVGGEYAEAYNRIVNQDEFDSLNMLYVACTRAVNRLYITTPTKPRKGTIGDFLSPFIGKHEAVEEGLYTWGEAGPPVATHQPKPQHVLQTLKAADWQKQLKLARKAPPAWEKNERDPREWGKRVHYVLSRIGSSHDVKPVIERLKNSGTINESDILSLEKSISDILAHPKVKASFSAGNNVFNERDILLPQSGNKRPDRISEGLYGKLTLVDYKTGEQLPKHKKQVEEYKNLLIESGFEVECALLVYINDSISVVELN